MKKAIGITSGIGSLLVGAKNAGFDVAGNIEWRQYYHLKDPQGTNTFSAYFPRAVFKETIEDLSLDEIQRLMGADIALGHPECGRYSRLSGSVKNRENRAKDPADIPLFVDLVARLKPKFFVMDDLPKSLDAYPMENYAAKLPEYDLFPEWISNWGYGNVQKGRDRMFMLGAMKDQRWAFQPGEQEHDLTVADVIGDLPKPKRGLNIPNQEPHDGTLDCFRALNLGGYRKKNTWAEVQEHFRDKRGGYTLEYPTAEGRLVKRIGFLKGHWDGPSHVLTGGNAILHHQRCDPYTIRERARIQGFPDDFVFYGTELNRRGEWNHDLNMALVKQTGKAMPIQFATYVSKQVMAHLQGSKFESTGRRVIHSNEDVDAAKRWYCSNVGYSDQERACGSCWMAAWCEIRTDRYGLPPLAPARQARTQGRESEPKPLRTNRGETPATPRQQTSHKMDIVREPIQTVTLNLRGKR